VEVRTHELKREDTYANRDQQHREDYRELLFPAKAQRRKEEPPSGFSLRLCALAGNNSSR